MRRHDLHQPIGELSHPPGAGAISRQPPWADGVRT